MTPGPDATLREHLRALPPSVWVLYLGTFVNRFGGFVLPFLVFYLGRRGYSAAQIGTVLAAYGVGTLTSSAAGGVLADRLGRVPTIALSMFSSAGMMMGLYQAKGLMALTLLCGLCGLCAELYRPAASALLADLVPPASRLTAFAAYRLAVNAGFAAGPAVAGYLAERSFFLLFLGDALTSLIYGLLAVLVLRPPRAAPAKEGARQGSALLRILREDTAFALFLLACLIVAFVEFQHLSSLPLWIERCGHGPRAYGQLISLNGLMIVFIEMPLTQVLRRFRPARVIAVGYALVGLGFGLTGVAYSKPALVGTMVLWTLGEMAWAPTSATYVANLAPEHMRGRYMGAYGLTFAVGLILAPGLGLRLFAAGPALLWALCGVLPALSVALMLHLARASLRHDKHHV